MNDVEASSSQEFSHIYVVRDGVVEYESEPIQAIVSEELTMSWCKAFFPSSGTVFFTIIYVYAMTTSAKPVNAFFIVMGVFCVLMSAIAVCIDCCVCSQLKDTKRALDNGGDWMIYTDAYSFVCNDAGDPVCVRIELKGVKRTAAMRRAAPGTRQKIPYRSFEYSRMSIARDNDDHRPF
jgi:hypothetical protein